MGRAGGGQGRQGRECGARLVCLVATRGGGADGPRPTQQLINSSNLEARGGVSTRTSGRGRGDKAPHQSRPITGHDQSALACVVARRSFLYPYPNSNKRRQGRSASEIQQEETHGLHSSPDHTGSEQQADFKSRTVCESESQRGPWKLVCVRLIEYEKGWVVWQWSICPALACVCLASARRGDQSQILASPPLVCLPHSPPLYTKTNKVRH